MTTALLLKIATPFISAAVTGVVKSLVTQYGKDIPSWLKPIISAIAGALTLATTGDPTEIVEGALIGGGGPAARETFVEIRDRFANG